MGYNLFAYCHNNPANKADPSGYWVETALDIAGLVWSIYDMCTEPSWENAGWLALDIVCIAVPILTGSYAVKAASKGTAKLLNASADVAKYSDDVIEGAGKVPNKVTDLAKDIKDWLGKDARVITNKNGDKVFMSGDGTKRIRFDINNTSPHNNPHGHVEELVNGKWVKSGPIYPTDVPHN